ncbi:hypothetical protein NPIL_586971 [Nephila pilipes]|uniref:Uncharacterized protein n=1 Tax=Nephila pilipes TaxID=299642 RepID=A0A8X6PKH2_NEPPI|nr:hypothetical protein NPIL_586971 [Nephila pilipes]
MQITTARKLRIYKYDVSMTSRYKKSLLTLLWGRPTSKPKTKQRSHETNICLTLPEIPPNIRLDLEFKSPGFGKTIWNWLRCMGSFSMPRTEPMFRIPP